MKLVRVPRQSGINLDRKSGCCKFAVGGRLSPRGLPDTVMPICLPTISRYLLKLTKRVRYSRQQLAPRTRSLPPQFLGEHLEPVGAASSPNTLSKTPAPKSNSTTSPRFRIRLVQREPVLRHPSARHSAAAGSPWTTSRPARTEFPSPAPAPPRGHHHGEETRTTDTRCWQVPAGPAPTPGNPGPRATRHPTALAPPPPPDFQMRIASRKDDR